MNSQTIPLLTLFISQFLFGCLYAGLVHWVSVRNFWPGSTAVSVIIGDGATLLIQWLFIRTDWDPLVTFFSFACSGLPMFITYQIRHQMIVEKKKESHKTRTWPNIANQMRETAIDGLLELTREFEQAAKDGTLNAGFLLGAINTVHGIIRVLKST